MRFFGTSATFALPFAAALLLAAPSPAEAGRLGQVTKGVKNRSDNARKAGSNSSGANRDRGGERERDYRRERRRYDHYGDTVYVGGYHYYRPCVGCEPVRLRARKGGKFVDERPHIDLYAGLQDVRESDQSLTLSARLAKNGMGFGVSTTGYHESAQLMKGLDSDISMSIWRATLEARILKRARTELWLSGGYGALLSNQFETLSGATFGAAMQHGITKQFGLSGQANTFILQDTVRGTEFRGGLHASVLSLSYRYLKLNSGPSLHGPEVGVSLRF